MSTFIILAIYILGVYTAYHQVQKWVDHKVADNDEYQMLFMISLLSWLVYPVYGLVLIFKKCGED